MHAKLLKFKFLEKTTSQDQLKSQNEFLAAKTEVYQDNLRTIVAYCKLIYSDIYTGELLDDASVNSHQRALTVNHT